MLRDIYTRGKQEMCPCDFASSGGSAPKKRAPSAYVPRLDLDVLQLLLLLLALLLLRLLLLGSLVALRGLGCSLFCVLLQEKGKGRG
jgi:hypothetical protein